MATQAKTDLTSGAPAHGARPKDVPPGTATPRHVAIIMDGNGRWAKKRFLPRIAGHRAGVEAVRRVARAARELGLECLTLYAFSSENWKRPAGEVADLMGLLRHFIQSDLDEFHANGVRLRIIGNYRALDPALVALIDNAVARTAGNSGPIIAIALNYGAQDELVRMAQTLARRVAAGEIAAEEIGLADVDAALYTADLPPLDLMIRTSGEQRLSNFMLWQAAYAELYFTDMLWPDFDGRALAAALDAFRLRDRRFGGL
ncbi:MULTISPECIES: isoprenyl transferase [unclassified Sphingobium]|uniref:isoprenyl transferase n=1 Tax=unclassified Sphingobium TaxID=2611147 RepID=UPI000C9F2B42|nr:MULTISPECIES: isoprenyl transferase [unclassified Sphingobium]MCB4859264.1 isoprenyl transferase [Sphingobium sp. PNB]PNP97789.1 di-trans,poly-cis-decaprenylcistransferase [Sphingobium sp. SA916]